MPGAHRDELHKRVIALDGLKEIFRHIFVVQVFDRRINSIKSGVRLQLGVDAERPVVPIGLSSLDPFV
jgi:hypothetical protein